MTSRLESRGQVLVLFVLFLLVLLGVSAVGIDYATWLLADRNLQNTADHAALAGASQFQDRTTATNCSGNKCFEARRQAWESLSDELNLGLAPGTIDTLAGGDTGAAGVTGLTPAFKDRVWVTTPPPTYAAYPGLYDLNHGVVFVRIDRAVTSFLGGALGVQAQVRTGWATAGALPTDFALEIFCRNHIAPQSGVCENSAGLTIDGQGGVTLLKGDVGSNESLTVTANVGAGLVMQDGNVFLVNRTCSNSTWRCPNGPPSLGGISDGNGNGKNAFYIAPLPVPRYESPTDIASDSACASASATSPCIPFQSQYGSVPGTIPGDWACNDGTTPCGVPNTATNPITCANAPLIKPGYWKSITIPAGGCAILDPAPSTGLVQYQLPGVYQFGGTGNGANAPRIVLGNGAFLIGDGVTLLFDRRAGNTGFPDNGIDIDRNGAMVINTGTPTSNPSAPLTALPEAAINAAWRIDNSDSTNPRNGEVSWPVCLTTGTDCVPRTCYMNTNSSACGGQTVTSLQFGRGISFYLTPNWANPSIQRRFYMGGNGNSDAPGVAFKAVLYAPYDDVKITGRNNFNTVGQVLAWTAKFNGGSASLFLDYPYDYTPASPYLLEPTVDH